MNYNEYRYPELRKDEEFMFLIQPSSQSDYSKLQESLIEDGCIEPIIVWHGLIVDGHKRYDICRRWSIPYSIRQSRCNTRDEVFSYICEKQLHRDDITSEMRKYLIGRMYQAEAGKIALAHSRKRQQENPVVHHGSHPKAYTKLTIAQIVSDRFDISPGTVLKYESYARCLNSIREKDPSLVNKILSGQLRISHENIVELERLPAHEIQALNKVVTENRMAKIGYSEIRHELLWKYNTAQKPPGKRPRTKGSETVAEIKKMPAHDPDSYLSSISLTAPSWVSVLDRARSMTDFKAASSDAKYKTLKQLAILKTSVCELEEAIKEGETNGGVNEVRTERTFRADSDQKPGIESGLSTESVDEARPEGSSEF